MVYTDAALYAAFFEVSDKSSPFTKNGEQEEFDGIQFHNFFVCFSSGGFSVVHIDALDKNKERLSDRGEPAFLCLWGAGIRFSDGRLRFFQLRDGALVFAMPCRRPKAVVWGYGSGRSGRAGRL